MKHLSPHRLAALADGLTAAPAEAAHLRDCPACRGELAGLRSLAQGMHAMPSPPEALRQATLQRLGLAKPVPAPAWRSPWLWGPALAAGLALALVLPRRCTVAPPAAAALAPAAGANPSPQARPLPHCAPAQAPQAAQAPAPPAAPMAGSLAAAPQAQAPLAVGAQAPQPPVPQAADVRGLDPGLKPTPGPGAISISSVRNNLLRSGSGGRFSLVLNLAGGGPLDATVLDERGRTVATLFHGSAGPGDLELQWDGAAPCGAYTVLIRSSGESRRVRVLVVH